MFFAVKSNDSGPGAMPGPILIGVVMSVGCAAARSGDAEQRTGGRSLARPVATVSAYACRSGGVAGLGAMQEAMSRPRRYSTTLAVALL
jgi:hypothetical protein